MKKDTLCINALKGIGAVNIAFFYHYRHFTNTFECLFPFGDIIFTNILFESGAWFVELFFMLSGFGMTLGYADKILNRQISFFEYMKKRVLKIYPLFLLTLLMTAIFIGYFQIKLDSSWMYTNNDLFHFILNLFMVQTGFFGEGGVEFSFNGPAWSISICMFCYLYFYCVLWLTRKMQIANIVFAISLGVSIIIFENNINYPFFNTCMAEGICCFSIGFFLAQLYKKSGRLNQKKFSLLAIMISLCIVIIRVVAPRLMGDQRMVYLLFFTALIIASLYSKTLNKIWSCRLFQFLGNISIGIYLFHYPVQCVMRIIQIECSIYVDYSAPTTWCIYVAFTILVCSFYQFIIAKWYEPFVKKLLNFNK